MLSFVEQLIRASYNLHDLLWYSTAKHKIPFLQDRSILIRSMASAVCALHSGVEAQCSNGPSTSSLVLLFYRR